MRKTSILGFLKFLFLFSILILMLPGHGQAQLEKEKPVKLKVALLPYLSFAPYFIAAEEGYFSEQGLQVEFLKFSQGSRAIVGLMRGELDVASGGMSSGWINAMAKEGKLRAVADRGHLDPERLTYLATVGNASLIEDIERYGSSRLTGRRIAVDQGGIQAYYASQVLRQMGLTVKDVKILQVPVAVKLEALQAGSLDLTVESEPWLTRLLRVGKTRVWMPAEKVIPGYQIGVIIYGPTLLEKNPDAGKRFMVAYLKAVRQYNRGKTERNLEIVAKHTDLDKDILKQACWPTFRQNGEINIQSLFDYQAWAVEQDYLGATIKEDRFWDSRFIEHANRVLGEKK
jgi:NitT/TauT family transport system substrate-binding protein